MHGAGILEPSQWVLTLPHSHLSIPSAASGGLLVLYIAVSLCWGQDLEQDLEQAMTYCDRGHCVTEKSAHNICSPTFCSLFCSLDWSVWLVLANRLWVEMPCVTSRTGRLRALRFFHLSLPSLQETLETMSWFTYRRTLNLWVIRELVLPHDLHQILHEFWWATPVRFQGLPVTAAQPRYSWLKEAE